MHWLTYILTTTAWCRCGTGTYVCSVFDESCLTCDRSKELDSPGHTTGIASGHPEHVACANKMPWSRYASEPPAGQLRIANESTIAFSKELFDSVADVFAGPMMSSGGDEVNLPCWEEDENFVHDLEAANTTIPEALDRFVREIQGVIKKHDKMPLIKSGEYLQVVHHLRGNRLTYTRMYRHDFDA